MGVGEVVLAVGVGNGELGGGVKQRVNVARGSDDAVDGGPLKIGIAERSAHEDGAGGEGAEEDDLY